jgi:hypothetical protein
VSTESRFKSEMGDSGQQQRPVRRYFSKEAKNRLIREGALRSAEGEARFDIDKVRVLLATAVKNCYWYYYNMCTDIAAVSTMSQLCRAAVCQCQHNCCYCH